MLLATSFIISGLFKRKLKHLQILCMVFLSYLVIFSTYQIPESYGHLDHFAHYNSSGDSIGKYYVYQAIDPEYISPNEPGLIEFSIQDHDGNDVRDVKAMVEVYRPTGERLVVFPWTKYEVGDFSVYFTFPQIGSYQIVLSVADGSSDHEGADAPRRILANNAGCDCSRGIFNVSVSSDFGLIFNSTIGGSILAFFALLGLVLGLTYRKRRGSKYGLSKQDGIKYIIMLSAIAGGLVHLAVYSEHASLRLEYSIFLIAAGGSQIAYGIIYILLTLSAQASTSSIAFARDYYRKTVILNLFGLVGTSVLLGLYAYSVILPPPLSPNNEPEAIEIAGIMAKAVEVFVVVGIVYLMRWEKKVLQKQVTELR